MANAVFPGPAGGGGDRGLGMAVLGVPSVPGVATPVRILRGAMGAAAVLCAAASTLSLVNLRHLRRPVVRDTRARISVLVPARDEADRIGPTLASLRTLTGVAQILVLDDHSSDDTAGLVQAAGLQVIRSTDEPPAGWLGKPWACQRLAEAATGDILVFIDADVELAPTPHGPQRACSTNWISCVRTPSGHHRRPSTTGSRSLQWSWLTFLPLAVAERSSHPALSAGNGQFVAVRRDAYFAAGGHAAVRGQVLEDLALVRRFKATRAIGWRWPTARRSRPAACTPGSATSSRDTRNHCTTPSVPTVALLGLMYVLPVAGLFSPDPTRRRALGAYLCRGGRTRGGCCPNTAAGRGRLAHPVSIVALGFLYGRSVVAARSSTITWRGRQVPGVTEQHRLPGDRGPVARAVLPVPPPWGCWTKPAPPWVRPTAAADRVRVPARPAPAHRRRPARRMRRSGFPRPVGTRAR